MLTKEIRVDKTILSSDWDNMGLKGQELLITVAFQGSPERARQVLKLSHSTFYRRWAAVKPYYNELIQEFSRKASEILSSLALRAAQELGSELNSANESVRHKAAVIILDKTLGKESIDNRLKKKITFEEWINAPAPNDGTNP